jgi:hypothetical protein
MRKSSKQSLTNQSPTTVEAALVRTIPTGQVESVALAAHTVGPAVRFQSAAWSPSYWFLGLFQQLNGSPTLAVLAQRAWIGLGAALSATVLAYALSYLRTLRKIVEEPDIVSGARGGTWLPRFGKAVDTAIVQFSLRALLRSRLHRIILAFYLGVGFALVIFLMKNSGAQVQAADAPAGDAWGQVNESLLAASIIMMGFAVIGNSRGFFHTARFAPARSVN